MQITYTLLASALFSLLIGLILFWISIRGTASHFNTTNTISWLLIALFPVFLIFAFFPDNSSASGNLLGIKISGALAAFMLVWMYGIRKTRESVKADDLLAQIRVLQSELQQLRSQPPGNGRARVPKVLRECDAHLYVLKKVPHKKIGLVTGNIKDVKCADIWVSSENTNMEMARFFDRSVSASIRYYGSTRDEAGDVTEDLIADELKKMKGNKLTVQPATVLVTGAGDLRKNDVKKIFHVAAVRGEVGVGYVPIDNVERCVRNALEKAEEFKGEGYKSILFPLLGTGTARAALKDAAERLIRTALSYLENSPNSPIEIVYFLTWSDVELQTCQEVLTELGERVTAVKP